LESIGDLQMTSPSLAWPALALWELGRVHI
jgi:hypothetical protein